MRVLTVRASSFRSWSWSLIVSCCSKSIGDTLSSRGFCLGQSTSSDGAAVHAIARPPLPWTRSTTCRRPIPVRNRSTASVGRRMPTCARQNKPAISGSGYSCAFGPHCFFIRYVPRRAHVACALPTTRSCSSFYRSVELLEGWNGPIIMNQQLLTGWTAYSWYMLRNKSSPSEADANRCRSCCYGHTTYSAQAGTCRPYRVGKAAFLKAKDRQERNSRPAKQGE